VIISVNLLLAFKAVSTFPGLEVKNSYVASQGFNDRKAAQEALGWTCAQLPGRADRPGLHRPRRGAGGGRRTGRADRPHHLDRT
jgi:hypothetical protein